MFLSNHWKSFKNLSKDKKYINSVYEKLLKVLSKRLNIKFKLNKPIKFWRVLIGPWLILYLVNNYDKWLIVKKQKKKVLKELKNYKIKKPSLLVNYDINDFYLKAREDKNYNYECLRRIINYKRSYIKDFKFKQQINYSKLNNQLPKRKIIHFLDYFFSFFSLFFSKYIIDIQYIPKKILLKIFLHSKIIPSLHRFNFFDFQREKVFLNYKERQSLFNKKSVYKFNDFEKFIILNLVSDFPIQYFEHFQKNREKIKFLSFFSKKIIISTVSYIFNEKFKFYLAEMISKNSKLVVIEHGGCLDYKFDSFLEHDDKICFKRVSWDKSANKKKIQLPVIQLLPNKNYSKKKNTKKILFLLTEILTFPMKLQCLPYNCHISKEASNFERILNKIHKQHHSNINIRYASNLNKKNNFITNRLKKKFPKINFYNYKIGPSFEEDLSRSQMVICTNADTPLSQSIASKRPTLLYMDKKHYNFSYRSNKMLKILKKQKIYFDNPNLLASMINKLAANPESEWFHSHKIEKILNLFEKNFFCYDKNWLPKWQNFLMNLC